MTARPMGDSVINKLRRWARADRFRHFTELGIPLTWPTRDALYVVMEDVSAEVHSHSQVPSMSEFRGAVWLRCLSPDSSVAVLEAEMLEVVSRGREDE